MKPGFSVSRVGVGVWTIQRIVQTCLHPNFSGKYSDEDRILTAHLIIGITVSGMSSYFTLQGCSGQTFKNHHTWPLLVILVLRLGHVAGFFKPSDLETSHLMTTNDRLHKISLFWSYGVGCVLWSTDSWTDSSAEYKVLHAQYSKLCSQTWLQCQQTWWITKLRDRFLLGPSKLRR